MGDCLCANEFGAVEGCTRDNWAAEYAKKLFDAEALARGNADSDLQEQINAEASARGDADGDLQGQITNNKQAIEREVSARTTVVANLNKAVADKQDAMFNYDGYCSVAEIAIDLAMLYNSPWGLNNEFTGIGDVASQVSRNTEVIQDMGERISAAANGLAAEEEARSVAVTALSDKISKQETYSATPVHVGWWIDGCPIWRVAIPLTAMSAIGIDVENSAWSLRVSDILYKLDIIATKDIVYIDDRIHFQNGNSYDPAWDAAGINPYNNGFYRGEATLLEDDGAQYFYGWIEFATPESNIVGS